jgi:colanic acid/amylovoran biosynthesis glycosyltransferase
MRTLTVVHSLPVWLPQTSPWLYDQIRFLPPEVDSLVVCERTANLDQFPYVHLYPLTQAPLWRYYWDLGLRKLRLRQHLGYLVSIARKNGARLIHSHWGDVAWGDMGAARAIGARHVVTFYGKEVNFLPVSNPIWRHRYLELFSHIDLVLCEGPFMARCIEELGCNRNKIRVHHLGVEIGSIEYRARQWAPGEPLRVLIAASFREKKGIPYALEALGKLKQIVPIEITIIGDSSEDVRSHVEKEKILSSLRQSGLLDKTRLLGYQTHAVLFSESYRHHVFISPSLTASDGDTEGGAPVALIDMAATGIPIVSSTHCDIPTVIKHGQTGLLAGERDSEALFEHLHYLVSHPETWAVMTAAGRKHVEEEFDARQQSQRLCTIYKELLDG